MWRSRIFWRLFAAYCVVLAVSFGTLGWILIGRLERHLLDDIRQNLSMKSLLIGELTKKQDEKELRDQVDVLAKDLQARLTLIAEDGRVLADSNEKAEQMENHTARPEVQEARREGIGVSIRYSGTVHQSMMYLARRQDTGPARYVRLALPLDAVASEIRWLHRVIWTTTGVTLLISLLLSFWIARRIITPLVKLAEATNSISRGAYGQRVLISSTDEIGMLAASFNEMSGACANHVAQMESDRQRLLAIFRSMEEGVVVIDAQQSILFLNDAACQLLGIAEKLAQNRKLWEVFRHRQLGEAVAKILASQEPYLCELDWPGPERKVFSVHGRRLEGEPVRGAVLVFHDITQLRKLERVRQDFVANVSHELKTPLAAIAAIVETLLDGALRDPDHNVAFLERIRENADRLRRLVLDLLTLGRIESGQETLELQTVSLSHAVDDCCARHAQAAAAKGLKLEQVGVPYAVAALADSDALNEILDNLVDNAIKYTPAGTITLRWFADGNKAVLQVEDTGVGILEKDVPRIFERFYRVDKARSRALGGTGLGLSIVKHLAQTLGGSVTARSEVGRGSVFEVRLPRASLEPTVGSRHVLMEQE